MVGKEAFIHGLQELGYTAENLDANRIAFQYTIKDGRFIDPALRQCYAAA